MGTKLRLSNPTLCLSADANQRLISMLTLANFLASVGGGRVVSAAKGMVPIKSVGSGAIFAFLVGSVLSLLLMLALKQQKMRVLVGRISGAALITSALLLGVYSWNAQVIGHSKPAPALDWLLFLLLVARCALWLLSRAMRSSIAVSVSPPYLAVVEAAYFAGFIVGLIVGPIVSTNLNNVLLLDLVLVCVVIALDYQQVGLCICQTTSREHNRIANKPSFWLLSGALGCMAVACQGLVFYAADRIARLGVNNSHGTADNLLAAFYLGVAVMATLCYYKPKLIRVKKCALLLTASLTLTLTGLWGIEEILLGHLPTVLTTVFYAAICAGAAIFELLFLAILSQTKDYAFSTAVGVGVASVITAGAMFVQLQLDLFIISRYVVPIVAAAATAGILVLSRRHSRPPIT